MSGAAARLWPLYAFGAAWMGVLVMPVYVPFLAGRGMTVGDALSLQAIFSLSLTVFEVPTGAICDAIGRRRTLLAGAVLNCAGLAGFASVHGFAAYAGVNVLLAAGTSLISGADVALMYDLLDDFNAGRGARRHALGNYVLAQVLGEAAASLLGGVIAGWSLRAVGYASAVEAVVPVAIALLLLRDGRGGHGMRVRAADLGAAGRALFADGARRLVFLNMVVWGLATFTAVWLLQPYWESQGVGLRWFGALWAATLVTVGIAGRCVPLMLRAIGPAGVMLVLTLGPVAAYAGMAALGGAGGIGCGFLFYVSRGLNSVHLKEQFNHTIPSRFRATFNSLASGSMRLLFACSAPLVGLLIDGAGLHAALIALAAVFAIAWLTLGLPLVRAAASRPQPP